MKTRLIYAMVLTMVVFAFIGCSKDDANSNEKEALKVTVSSSSDFTNDLSDVSVLVGTYDSNGKPMQWTVNGESGTDGQDLYTVNKEYFYGGKTAVLQSLPNYLTASVTISAFSITVPFSVTYKVEQGNTIKVEKTVEIKPGASPLVVQLSY